VWVVLQRAKLSYAQIAQRGKEQNDGGVITSTQNAGVDSNPIESTNNELSKETNQASQASSEPETSWKTRSSSSSSFEQRQSSNTSASHLKNSRFPAGRGGGTTFVGGHRQRTYNGVATVGSSKH